MAKFPETALIAVSALYLFIALTAEVARLLGRRVSLPTTRVQGPAVESTRSRPLLVPRVIAGVASAAGTQALVLVFLLSPDAAPGQRFLAATELVAAGIWLVYLRC